MKKRIAISFLLIYLITTTELSQFLKTPMLVQHFIEHKEINNRITITQFLYAHYAIGEKHGLNHEKGNQLPFKSHENCVASISNIYLPAQKITLIKPVSVVENTHCKTQLQFLPSIFLSNIWQPPRIC